VLLFVGLKRPRYEANHYSPSTTEVKNVWSYTSPQQYVFRVWDIVKPRGNFRTKGKIFPALKFHDIKMWEVLLEGNL
jgi:hypothetical protein